MIFKLKDNLNRTVKFNFPPEKIVSAVPSITETLFDLGLADKIKGVTKYCIHPAEAQNKTIIGGTKNINKNIIDKINPDIIFAEKSENNKENIEKTAENHNVFVFDIHTFNDALIMIESIGKLTDTQSKASTIVNQIKKSFENLNVDFRQKTVFFPVWKNPFFTISSGTFINSMLEIINLKNIFSHKKQNYPQIQEAELKAQCPDFIFLPSEPCHFTEKDKNYFTKLCPASKIMNVDGEMFAWYGTRLMYAADYFKTLFLELFST